MGQFHPPDTSLSLQSPFPCPQASTVVSVPLVFKCLNFLKNPHFDRVLSFDRCRVVWTPQDSTVVCLLSNSLLVILTPALHLGNHWAILYPYRSWQTFSGKGHGENIVRCVGCLACHSGGLWHCSRQAAYGREGVRLRARGFSSGRWNLDPSIFMKHEIFFWSSWNILRM